MRSDNDHDRQNEALLMTYTLLFVRLDNDRFYYSA